MKKCSRCNANLENRASFCHICGAVSEVIADIPESEIKEDQADGSYDGLVVIKKPMSRKKRLFIGIALLMAFLTCVSMYFLLRTPDYEKPVKAIFQALEEKDMEHLVMAYLPECRAGYRKSLDEMGIFTLTYGRLKYLGITNAGNITETSYDITKIVKANEYSLENFKNHAKVNYNSEINLSKGYYIHMTINVTTKQKVYTSYAEAFIGKTKNGWGCIDWNIKEYSVNMDE